MSVGPPHDSENMTPNAALELVPVEKLAAGDVVHVGRRTGLREVLSVKRFPAAELLTVDGRTILLPEAFVVVYRPTALGTAFENRAKAARGIGYYHREEASFTRKPGELVERRAS